ncbi:membrane cofactor protein-like isoform X2 [Acipenser ruthenus]|uniref:membrane cofactor protein-like isoform X2 n=1 Tax=Acipenser ruthenus TaxID=7906 RepID=UPI00145ACF55|nr:membrane cofactor protein-like isoform X2 [Acipenser ruthenus]
MPGRNTNSADNVFMISLCVGLALLIVRVSGQCGNPPDYPNVIMTTQPPPNLVEGSTITYACQIGYVRNSGSTTITCTSSQWSQLTLVCEGRSCGSPGEIFNGRFNTDEGVLFGDKAYAVCDEGFQMAGSGVRNCLATGWDGEIPRCEIIKCPNPTEIVNGEITNPPPGTVTFGTVIIYKCNEGILVGNKELVCTKYGNYSSDPPACKDHKGCPSVQVENGRKVAGFGPDYNYGDFITFACNSGYILHGTDTVTCGVNEIWEPELPTCQKEVPPTPSPGFIYVIVGLLIAAVAVTVAVGFWFFKNSKGSYYTAEKYEMKLAVNDEQQNMNSDLSLNRKSSSPRTAAVY